jgi:glycogen debranching enzyme
MSAQVLDATVAMQPKREELNDIDHREVVAGCTEFRYRFGAYYKKANWRLDPQLWRQFIYIEDRFRGQSHREDIWSPGAFDIQVTTEPLAAVLISTKLEQPAISIPWDYEESPLHVPWIVRDSLQGSARQFVVTRSAQNDQLTSIIAGYPWFSDWGRDAMISLPGLLLCAERFEDAKSVLHLFAAHLRNGLIPNHFDDATGEPRYNTVDALPSGSIGARAARAMKDWLRRVGRSPAPIATARISTFAWTRKIV